jgi:predicted MPP superfamily phosphohydrolase
MLSRRKFLGTLVGAGVGACGVELWRGSTPFPEACTLSSIRVPAPAGWAGKTAVFVTDVHYGNAFGPSEARLLGKRVRALRPALVLMGGDLAQTPTTDLTGFLQGWEPGCPTIFAPGNHDITVGMGGSVLAQARRGGMLVLANAVEHWDGIAFVGLPSALRARQDLALLGGPGLQVVLGHEPDMWDCYYPGGDLLHLAGHTHGGQIRIFGRPVYLPALGRKYPHGIFRADGRRTLLVSSGIGYTEVPARINCPPEIVQIFFT